MLGERLRTPEVVLISFGTVPLDPMHSELLPLDLHPVAHNLDKGGAVEPERSQSFLAEAAVAMRTNPLIRESPSSCQPHESRT